MNACITHGFTGRRLVWPALIALTVLLVAAGCSSGGMQPRADNLDPQMSWPYAPERLAGTPGKFYVNGQNEGIITVFDADSQKRLKIINFWEYEYDQVRKTQGREPTEAETDFIQKNMRPHHSWITPGGRYNYVSNNAKASDRFWVVDIATDEIVAHFQTGGMGPLHGAFSPYRDLAVWGAVQDRKHGVATFIDTRHHKVLGTVKTSGTRTRDVVFTPDNKHVYITNSGWDPKKGEMGGVDMIDLDAMKVVKTFPIQSSKGMKMSYDGRIAGVTGFRTGEVTFIDATRHQIIATVKVGGQPNNISFNWDNTKAYVGIYKEKVFAVIDLKTMSLKTKIKGGKQANAVYFPPGNRKLAIGTNESDDFVTLIDVTTDTKIKDVPTPLGAHNVAFTPDGKVAVISCKKSREAVFFDVANQEEIDTYPEAGHGNNGVRWAPYPQGLSPGHPYAMR